MNKNHPERPKASREMTGVKLVSRKGHGRLLTQPKPHLKSYQTRPQEAAPTTLDIMARR